MTLEAYVEKNINDYTLKEKTYKTSRSRKLTLISDDFPVANGKYAKLYIASAVSSNIQVYIEKIILYLAYPHDSENINIDLINLESRSDYSGSYIYKLIHIEFINL